jgi:hypothetical protein
MLTGGRMWTIVRDLEEDFDPKLEYSTPSVVRIYNKGGGEKSDSYARRPPSQLHWVVKG